MTIPTTRSLNEAQMSPTADFITRPEMDRVVESLNREFSGLNTKMDQLLGTKYEEASRMGALQQQVKGLADEVKSQAASIRRIEQEAGKIKSSVKDDALKIAWEVIKFGGALLIGYIAKRGL